jgi:hypothetical protein
MINHLHSTLFSTVIAIIGLFLPQLALADEPLSGADFEAYVQGRMLTFFSDGIPYGAEQYFPNNRVRWAFDQDTCLEGVWYEHGTQICFIYEDDTTPQCWAFFQNGDTLKAVFADTADGASYEALVSDGPLSCTAPGLGV